MSEPARPWTGCRSGGSRWRRSKNAAAAVVVVPVDDARRGGGGPARTHAEAEDGTAMEMEEAGVPWDVVPVPCRQILLRVWLRLATATQSFCTCGPHPHAETKVKSPDAARTKISIHWRRQA